MSRLASLENKTAKALTAAALWFIGMAVTLAIGYLAACEAGFK
jgi:hypothetical protein